MQDHWDTFEPEAADICKRIGPAVNMGSGAEVSAAISLKRIADALQAIEAKIPADVGLPI